MLNAGNVAGKHRSFVNFSFQDIMAHLALYLLHSICHIHNLK